MDVDSAVLRKRNIHPSVIPVAAQNQEYVAQQRHHEDVQDAEPDEHGSDPETVSSVRQTPGERIIQPQDICPGADEEVVAGEADTASGAMSFEGAEG